MKENIKEVFIDYEASGVLKHALESTGVYRPSSIERLLKLNYALKKPETESKKVSLYISMNAQNSDKIRFYAIEYRNNRNSNFDFNTDINELAEFEISLPKAVGSKNWQFYIRSKNERAYVATPTEAFNNWTDQNNFHDALADKLKKSLQEHGLICCWDLNGSCMEARLIGSFLEYRTLIKNQKLLEKTLGL